MDSTHTEASLDTHAVTFDTLARSLHGRLPRRRMAGLLAALAAGAFGIGAQAEITEAKRKRGKRGKGRTRAEALAATSIPPNCIYVCCDGTCDSWKMCLKCFTWPKATGTTTLAG
jgi:hypothetical protein